ncbi:MAG: FkbM family methyltransferase [Chthoniobacterales bacterium]|nr:FkbM family methyltransferase [Chthoniobacterales bacterium]
MLHFRDGLNVMCRRHTRDWDVVHELLFAKSYQRALYYLRDQPGHPIVLDLGGNIGLFSLLASAANRHANVVAFEPGPPNYALFEINRLANPTLSDRIELRKKAVGGTARSTEWFFDETNPGGSGLFSAGGKSYPVDIIPFAEAIAEAAGNIALVKIDIEGAEYEILNHTGSETWERVQAISLELHDDPGRQGSQDDFLARLQSYGFRLETESVCSYFLSR